MPYPEPYRSSGPAPRHWMGVVGDSIRSAADALLAHDERKRQRAREEKAENVADALLQIQLATNPRLRDVTGQPEPTGPSVMTGVDPAGMRSPSLRGSGSVPSLFGGVQGLGDRLAGVARNQPNQSEPVAPNSRPPGMGWGRAIMGESRPSTPGADALREVALRGDLSVPGFGKAVSPGAGNGRWSAAMSGSSTPLMDTWQNVPPRNQRVSLGDRVLEILPEQPWSPSTDPQILLEEERRRRGLGSYAPQMPEINLGGRTFADTPQGRTDALAWDRELNPPTTYGAGEMSLGEQRQRSAVRQQALGNAATWLRAGQHTRDQVVQLVRRQHNLTPGDAASVVEEATEQVGSGTSDRRRAVTQALGWQPVNAFEDALVDALADGQTPGDIFADMEAAGQPPEAINAARAKLASVLSRYQ